MKMATHSEEQSLRRKANINTRPISKIARILSVFLTGASFNRFEAERIGDHCLHSTISDLTNRHGLNFKRQNERVPNHWGKPCTVVRYSLPESERQKALAVMKWLTRKSDISDGEEGDE